MEKPDCRLTLFLFGLFAITFVVSGDTVVPNARIVQQFKLLHISWAAKVHVANYRDGLTV